MSALPPQNTSPSVSFWWILKYGLLGACFLMLFQVIEDILSGDDARAIGGLMMVLMNWTAYQYLKGK